MADIVVEGDEAVLRLSLAEKAGSLHGDIRVPRAAVTSVKVVERPLREVRGLRAPGTGVPGVIALGTWRRLRGKDFVAAYRRPGVVVELEGAPFERLVVSCPSPAEVRARLTGPFGWAGDGV